MLKSFITPEVLLATCVLAIAVGLVGCGQSDAKTGLSATHRALVLKNAEVCSGVELTNHGPDAVTLGEILLNGEHAAVHAEKSSQRYIVSGKPLPPTLDDGESVLVFHRDLETRPAENYMKDVTFVLVRTPAGDTRVAVTSEVP